LLRTGRSPAGDLIARCTQSRCPAPRARCGFHAPDALARISLTLPVLVDKTCEVDRRARPPGRAATNRSGIATMSKVAIFACVAVSFAGCATSKTWSATGGSRSDGVVRLSYEYLLFQIPHVDDQQGLEIAESRCRSWGYSGSEPFGGQTRVCNNMTNSGCNSWLVTREYQCLGDLEK